MSEVSGLTVATSGFRPRAYLTRFGRPSPDGLAVAAVWPKDWSRHVWLGVAVVIGSAVATE